MKDNLKQLVIRYLEAEHGDKWVWAGTISRAIHDQTGHKESVIERHGLRGNKMLEVSYEQVDGKGSKCAKYKLAKVEVPIVGTIENEVITFKQNQLEI